MSKKGIFLSVVTIVSIVIDAFCLIGTMLLGLPSNLIDIMTLVSLVAMLTVVIVIMGSMFLKFLYIAAAATAVYEGVAFLLLGDMLGIALLAAGVLMTVFIPKVAFKNIR